MPHIHSDPGQIDHTITAFIVRFDDEQPKMLLHMHKKYHRLLPAGGHIELHETPWAAVAHEIREETGYDLHQLQVMQPALRIDSLPGVANHPHPLRVNTHQAAPQHFHSDLAYLFITNQAPAHAPEKGESTDIRWLTRTDIMQAGDNVIHSDTKQTAIAIFDQFLHDWTPVPATNYSVDKPEEK